MLKVSVFIQHQVVVMISAPWLRNRARGRRLTRNAIFTAVFTWSRAHPCSRGFGLIVVITGDTNSAKMIIRLEAIISAEGCIAATWICTKSFWFLRPTDELLSFRSMPSEPWGSTKGAKISSLRCWRASLGGQGGFNPCF